ncbi:uncharacterized protein LOC108741573 isoform X2 [Agrilus planipennis]|uniref:Uncharacterized protein LOC108741573 isoform X2 n=1 Tax=Agrilus planipennis TaxID=224129 RepID=A0A1W4XHS6_AGRPL|nr:uncharacterized protein LOC108741573 isoform X2 [Agrilus planipennis]
MIYIKSKSENNLWLEINKKGELTKELIVLFIFTFSYGTAVNLHHYTFRYWGYSVRRCEIPVLEDSFNFDQVLDISTYGVTPEVRFPGSIIYCKYADRDYNSLLKSNNNNYESIMKSLRIDKTPFNEKTCAYKIKERRLEPQLSLLSKSFQNIFDERNKTCKDFKYYRITQKSQFLGVIFGALSMSTLADRYGRRPIFIGCYICEFLGLLLFFVPFVSCMILGNFLTGIGLYGFLVLYIILTERCDRKRRLILGTSVLVCIPLSKIIGVIIEVVGNKWMYPIITSLTILTIIAPVIHWFVDEPPKYLMYSGRVQKCIKVLEKYGYRRDTASNVPKMPVISTTFIATRFFHAKLRARHAYSFFLSYLLSIVGVIHETHAVITGKFDMTVANILTGIFECIHIGIMCFIISRDLYGRKDFIFTFFLTMTLTHMFVFAQYDRTACMSRLTRGKQRLPKLNKIYGNMKLGCNFTIKV